MQFVKPIPFEEAIDKLGRKTVVGSIFTSSEWADMPAELREQAFFSSRVESVRVLQRAKDALGDFLKENREVVGQRPDGTDIVALKTGSRQQFVDMMQDFLSREGIERGKGGLMDITSERRLGLIFNTLTQQAQDYGYWKQGMDPDVLNEFPAQRFVRVVEVKEPRNAHTEFEGKVYLKTDPIWTRINEDFGVPWGPWGWGCGHDVEDVDRDEAESLGLLQAGEEVAPDARRFTENMQASTRGLEPELLAKLKGEFGDRLVIEGDTMRWNAQPAPTSTATPQPPAPAPAPPKPVQRPWREDMDSLVTAMRTSPPHDRARLREDARKVLEVPAAQRGTLKMDVVTTNKLVQNTAERGQEIIERFVDPKLVNNTHVSIHRTHEVRSFHTGDGEVHLWSGADASTAAHEIMHAVEQQNPGVLKAAAEFLLKRGEGELPVKLSTLTGNPNYKPQEVAFRDKWKERYGSHYAGKVYSWSANPEKASQFRATEVLTMGIERLLADPIEFYQHDPEWMSFVVSTLRGI